LAADMTKFLVAQLEAYGLRVTGADGAGSNLLCACFNGHGTNTPCLSVRKTDGAFICFSCDARGRNWEALVKALGGNLPDDEDIPDPFGILNAQLPGMNKESHTSSSLPWGVEPWTQGKYRGLSPGFLTRVGAQRWYDDKMRCQRILFPIWQKQNMDKEGPGLQGWVARRIDDGTEMKYRNSPGMKAARILYPYNFVRKHLRNKVVVLVEGPMDALRLCHFRIPALAIMGTNNWHSVKLRRLLRLGVKHVIICTDGDVAGKRCRYEKLEPELSEYFEVEHFFPPDDEDPCSMSKQLCLQLRDRVQELAAALAA